jgi:hypothetical protein
MFGINLLSLSAKTDKSGNSVAGDVEIAAASSLPASVTQQSGTLTITFDGGASTATVSGNYYNGVDNKNGINFKNFVPGS